MSDLKGSVTRGFGKAKLTVIKKSPELLLAAGIISGGAALVFAVKETLRAEEVLDKHDEKMTKIEDAKKVAAEDTEVIYTDNDAKKDTFKAYAQTGWEFAKLYAPTVIFAGLSVTCILTSHGIMRKRNLALAATLATVRTAFDDYRGRVVRDLGKEMDEHFLYDTIEETREREVTGDNGKIKTVKEKVKKSQYANAYSRIFDNCNCPDQFEKDGSSNYIFIRGQMIYLQNKLIRDGYLFLNDVYKTLGFPITLAGQSAGWIYDYENRDNTAFKIEGLEENELYNSDAFRDLMNGYENSVMLNFLNVRDNILTDLPRVDSTIDAI